MENFGAFCIFIITCITNIYIMQTVALKFTLQILFLGSSGQMTAGRFHGLLDVGAGDASKTKMS